MRVWLTSRRWMVIVAVAAAMILGVVVWEYHFPRKTVMDVASRFENGVPGQRGIRPWPPLRRARRKRALSVDDSVRVVTDVDLVQLQDVDQLTALDVSNSNVSDVGLALILRLKQLKSLNLSATRVSDAGLVCLEGLTHLESLTLSPTGIGDAGCAP